MSNFRRQYLENHRLRNRTGDALSVSESSGPGRARGREIQADGALSKSKPTALPVSEPKIQITGPGVLSVIESVRCGPVGQMDEKKLDGLEGFRQRQLAFPARFWWSRFVCLRSKANTSLLVDSGPAFTIRFCKWQCRR